MGQSMRSLIVKSAIAASLISLVLIFSVTIFVMRKAPLTFAYYCPDCFGFDDMGEDVFVEPRLADIDRERLRNDIASARSTVSKFYGQPVHSNRFIVCATGACNEWVNGGSAKAFAVGDNLVYVSPAGRNETILTHELAHVQLHAMLGDAALDDVPAWFDEGLAVVVSKDDRYLQPSHSGLAACRIEDDGRPLPTSKSDWLDAAPVGDHMVYAWAACRVSSWLKIHDGAAGVKKAVDAIRSGRKFDASGSVAKFTSN